MLGISEFGVVELSLNDNANLASFDGALLGSRVGCLLVTRRSLFRLLENDNRDKVLSALKMLDDRTPRAEQKSAVLVLEGVAAKEIPSEWSFARTIELPLDSIATNPLETLDSLYSDLRADTALLGASPSISSVRRGRVEQRRGCQDGDGDRHRIRRLRRHNPREIRIKQFNQIGSVLAGAQAKVANKLLRFAPR